MGTANALWAAALFFAICGIGYSGIWTPFYGLGAILTHWVSGTLRDVTGIYDLAFFISAVFGALALVLICFVKRKG